MALIALRLCRQYFRALFQVGKLELGLWSDCSLYLLKSFSPPPALTYPSSPAKWFGTDGTTTFDFSDSLDLTC